MSATEATALQESVQVRRRLPWWRLLLRDRFATASVVWFGVLAAFVLIGPIFLTENASSRRVCVPGFASSISAAMLNDPKPHSGSLARNQPIRKRSSRTGASCCAHSRALAS